MAVLFARNRAQLPCGDRDIESAIETAAMIAEQGGTAVPFQADVSRDADCAAVVAEAKSCREGSTSWSTMSALGGGGDGPAHRADEAAWDRILAVNHKSASMTIKHAVPIMGEQGGGSIVNLSFLASLAGANQVAYEVSKAGMNRLTTSVANAKAGRGLRNAVLPGPIDTPMGVAGIVEATGSSTDAVREADNARVPLRGKLGTAWDTARAALFLTSDEAHFITGVLLPVDGGMAARVG